jgi:hypothetical protein
LKGDRAHFGLSAAQLSLLAPPITFDGSSPASMIIDDKLWLGSIDSARDAKWLESARITHICDVNGRPTTADKSMYDSRSIAHRHYQLEDTTNFVIRPHFATTHAFLDEAKAAGGRILVHCAAGVSRSATILMSWVMKEEKRTLADVMTQVRSRRPFAYPNRSFFAALIDYDRELYGRTSLPPEVLELHEDGMDVKDTAPTASASTSASTAAAITTAATSTSSASTTASISTTSTPATTTTTTPATTTTTTT